MSKLGTIGKAILEHHGFFSLDQIAEETKFPRKSVSDTLFILSQEGLIKKITKQRKEHIPGHSPRFSLTYRFRNRKALAARIAPRLKEGTEQDRMWFVIRKRKHFTLQDIVILARVKNGMARWYLKTLRGMGIIRASRTGGGPGVEWMLINDDLGLKRPYIKSRKKTKTEGMGEKTIPKNVVFIRNIAVKFLMSKAEVEFLKEQASRLNLPTSAYIRMLIYKARGTDKKAPRK